MVSINENEKNDLKESIVNSNLNQDDEDFAGSYIPRGRLAQETPTQTRTKRTHTLNIRCNENKNIKILIPFDMDLGEFSLPSEAIDIYDFKTYLKNTLARFNGLDEFKLKEDYQATGCRRIFHLIIYFIIHLLFIYLTFCLWHLLFFNFIMLMTLIKAHIKFYSFTHDYIKNINNKAKISKMKQVLIQENKSTTCRDNKYIWTCGDHGYWIEMEKTL